MTESSSLKSNSAASRDRAAPDAREQKQAAEGVALSGRLNGWLQSRDLHPPK